MICRACKAPIPVARIDAFAERGIIITTCVGCSTEEPVVTFMVYGHKTGGAIVVVPNDAAGRNNPEAIRIAKRANRRAR